MPSSPKKQTPQAPLHNKSISIVNVKNSGSLLNSYISYNIETIESPSSPSPIRVSRRYSEFLWLYERVSLVPGLILAPFPEKFLLEGKSDLIVSQRLAAFTRLLLILNGSAHPFANSELNAFLKTADDEFKLRVKTTPSLLPRLPAGVLAKVSSNFAKLDSGRFLEFALHIAELDSGRPLELDLAGGKWEAGLRGFEEVEALIPEEENPLDQYFLDPSTSLVSFVSLACREVVEKIEQMQENEETDLLDKEAVLRKAAAVFAIFSKNSRKDKERARVLGEAAGELGELLGKMRDSFKEMLDVFEHCGGEIDEIGLAAEDVKRVKSYFFEMKEKYLNADVLLKNHAADIAKSASLAEKVRLEKSAEEIKKFMAGVRVLLHVYAERMPREIERFEEKKDHDIIRISRQLSSGIREGMDRFLKRFKGEALDGEGVEEKGQVEV